ncbi:gamma-glutamyl peptidase 5-like [Punica granatum]|uniref:Glutamine amidotransferase domain-containing protein n=2 Tax=Punica granatum TaxID=22663 RepID=A0A218XSD3_PUNGR|nr:gamma-glutamyl peptidase 5-like [Punica granatum]OWM87718.1 hypothetical protein CDL15_Pgr016414 [Punica granatum]PKI33215.1 hypothetical protein CRG98_046384 [Punica granatum]
MGSLGVGGGRRFAVLLCAEDSEYVRERYGGYLGVFKAMLADEVDAGESWDLFRAVAGELPGEAEAELYDGFVITGSCSDAYGDDVWIRELLSFVKKIDSMKKKILGVCFGHQIISRAIGGKVGRAKSWDIGLRKIQLSLTSKPFSSLNLPTMLSIIECHRDEVKELPPKAEVIARSSKTRIEMFRYGNHIMGIQGHPEYTEDILLHLIDRLLQRNFITKSYAEELKVNVDVCEPDREAWKRLCISFLKGGL